LGITDRYGMKDVKKIYVLRVKIKRILFENEIFEEVGGI